MGGMKLWKRIMFSVVSIIWGFASLDYLYYAFRLMTGKTRSDGSYAVSYTHLTLPTTPYV